MRTNHWPTKLDLFFQEKAAQPFDWKENNCAFFAADWINICLGLDPVKEFRDMTAKQLLKFFREQPMATVISAKCEEFGWPEVAVAFAQRGDLVTCTQDDAQTVGVCNGLLSAFAGPEGVLWRKTATCNRAWRIN